MTEILSTIHCKFCQEKLTDTEQIAHEIIIKNHKENIVQEIYCCHEAFCLEDMKELLKVLEGLY